MIKELEGFMSCNIQQMEHRLNMFLDMNANMLEWTVHFNNSFENDVFYKEALNERISHLAFGYIGNDYIIGRYIREMITSYVVSSDFFRQSVVYYSTSIDHFSIRDITVPLNQCFRYRAIYCRSIVMHASAVIYNGEVILFTGVSGTGKSTQADLWKEYANATVLNYDQALVFLQDSSVEICGTPWAGKENIYRSGVYPLKAIVLVEKSEETNVAELSKGEAFSRVYLNNYLYPINEEIENLHCDSISRLVTSIPVFELRCSIGQEPVDKLYKIIYG